jgi:hypothetical protein
MKTNFLLVFLLWAGIAFGQENDIKKKGNYYLNYPASDQLTNFKATDNTDKTAFKNTIIGKKRNVKVKKVEAGQVTFEFTDKLGGGLDEGKTYTLPVEEFKNTAEPNYNRVEWRFGVYTIPFKLRFGGFSFDANVNLGTSIGAKIRMKREIENGFALEPIFGFGIASIKLDTSNSSTSSGTNVSAFTINTGVLIHITKAINIGLTYGFDNMSKNDQELYNWKYNGKGWLGLGINVTLNNESNNTGAERSEDLRITSGN